MNNPLWAMWFFGAIQGLTLGAVLGFFVAGA
jgi:hypothetical protein